MVKHSRIGEETLNSLQLVTPQQYVIDGKPYLSFRDILYNLILNNVKGMDYDTITKKVDTITKKPMGPAHRKRLAKQLKKLQPRKSKG